MKLEIVQCPCGSKPRRRSFTQGVFKFKYLRCPSCELRTDSYTRLSEDDDMIEEWNQMVERLNSPIPKPDPPEEVAALLEGENDG